MIALSVPEDRASAPPPRRGRAGCAPDWPSCRARMGKYLQTPFLVFGDRSGCDEMTRVDGSEAEVGKYSDTYVMDE